MLPEQDWSKLMEDSDEKHQKPDDFGKTLLESLGSFGVDGVSTLFVGTGDAVLTIKGHLRASQTLMAGC
jgi:hypothetical protein